MRKQTPFPRTITGKTERAVLNFFIEKKILS